MAEPIRIESREDEKNSLDELSQTSRTEGNDAIPELSENAPRRAELPLVWQVIMGALTCCCTFGNHWSNGLIVALKSTIISHLKINNSQFATLVAVTNLANTFLCVAIGLSIDTWGGPLMSIVLAAFHLAGTIVMAGSATNQLFSYPLLVLGKVIAAVGDGSLDNAQHRIFSTYFAPGKGFAFSVGAIWSIANLAQFTGQSTANIISRNLGSFAWSLWISSVISLFSLVSAIAVFILDKYLRRKYNIIDQTNGKRHTGVTPKGRFNFRAIRHLPLTFWIVVIFSVFENAGVQSFVSISTQFAQQRLKKGAVVGGWVSSFYLLLPAGLTPFLGIVIDGYGHRVSFLFLSGVTFLISMLLLKFSHSVPTFVAAYVFYALAQSVTPAPQVEIIRSIIPDPQYYATGFAIKKSIVQASIVIITTAAGKLQDLSKTNSLDPAVSLWLAYAFASVAISGFLLISSYTAFGKRLLPALRLSQVKPSHLKTATSQLWAERQARLGENGEEKEPLTNKQKEVMLKEPTSHATFSLFGLSIGWLYPALGVLIVFIGWIMFGLGVGWGVHGSVIAGTVGE